MRVRVRLRGGRLGPLDRYVSIGDVFAVTAVRRTTRPAAEPVRSATGKVIAPTPGAVPKPAFPPEVREYTYLRVIEPPRDGVCTCLVLTQYADPFPVRGQIAGYRCLKLTTTAAPLAVRVVRGDGRRHEEESKLRVWATANRFTADPR